MKQLNFILMLFTLSTTMYAQQFNEISSLPGVLYGEALWLNSQNNGIDKLVVTGYDVNYNNSSVIYIYQNGNFTQSNIPIEPFGYASIDKINFNNDGYDDFIITGIDSNDNSVIHVYENDGTGSFSQNILPHSGITTGKIRVADLNNNGYDDFVITGMDDNYNYTAQLYINNGNGSFTPKNTPFFGNTYGSISFFDADNDGHLDVLLTGFDSNALPDTKLYINDGSANFTENTQAGIQGVYFSDTDIADYNNDGSLDVLISGFNTSFVPYTALYENDGNGNFSVDTNVTLQQLYWGTVKLIDYDNDNDLDIFINGYDPANIANSILYTNNNGVFTQDTLSSNAINGTYISASNWIDIDNDGDIDFILTGLNNNMDAITKIYENTTDPVIYCEPTFSSPNSPTEPISFVEFNTISNTSDAQIDTNVLQYEDFSSISTNVTIGSTYTLTVKGNTNGNNTNYITVFIDWNQDGIFSSLLSDNEKYQNIPVLVNSDGEDTISVSHSITIPANAITGNTRMRVMKNYNAPTPDPCVSAGTFGQVEDYTIIINTCLQPTNITTDNITDTQVDVAWDASPDETNGYNWILVAQGDSPVTANTIQDGNVTTVTTNLTITNLTPETPYDIYIQTNCNNNESEWEGPINFTTTEITCEQPINITTNNITDTQVDVAWDTSPDETNGYNWILVAQGDSPVTANTIQNGNVTTGITNLTITNLTPETPYDIYIQTNCNNNESEWEGPINFTTEPEHCEQPINITTNNITDTQVDVAWDSSLNETNGYNWILVAQGDSPVTANTIQDGNVNTGTTNLTITNLTPETPYDIYIQTNCNNNESEWEGPINFTTEPEPCEQPINITTNNITDTQVDVAWDASLNETNGYNWILVAQGDSPVTANTIQDGNVSSGTTNLTITSLTPETPYDIYIQTNCANNESEWEGPISFTTTEITCETPQNLSVDEITGNLVEISWTEPTITDNINTYNWIAVVEGSNPENEENIVQEGSVTVGTHTLTLSNLDPGTYDLYLFADCNENLNEALIITFEVESLSVSTIEGLDTIKIYPNPAKHDFYIETTTVLEKIELFDLNGRRIFSKNEHTKQFHFDISELATGVYLLKIQAGTDTKVYRLVKE